ncbi:MAG: N-methyl-D-aspartate receptor NMDAR2C subunit [Candidatus Eremiobacteraeota bacterium]|nr:N-methyl-D-aspartate receptor NMDAR2C subunit [Candidatus Eremiobacteraeota bacterium]MCW5870967.1 N-methyl-D-aspartate receptor NMDAR2C subunit [Candidatus Eremiobacteraeota bacterium]
MDTQDSLRRERLRQRWQKLLPELDSAPLLEAYSQPGRGYHNLEHLEEVLEWVDRVPLPEHEKDRLSLALFYHDAVYDGKRGDNEQASADWCRRDLGERAEVELILDTRHSAQPASELGRWMVDIDLSVLGAEPSRFDRYEQGVRQEYSWVPWFLFRRKRKQILLQFLERPHLYFTEFFRQRLETSARANLQRAVAAL